MVQQYSANCLEHNASENDQKSLTTLFDRYGEKEKFNLSFKKLGKHKDRFKQICDLLLLPSSRCESLDLRHNHLDANDAAHLANVITMNSTIRDLDLRFNNLGTDGAIHISMAMQFNRSLHHCQLQGNSVNVSLLSRIENYCRRNRLNEIRHEDRSTEDRYTSEKLLYRLRFESAQVCNQHAVTKRRLLLSEQRLMQLDHELANSQHLHNAQLKSLVSALDEERQHHALEIAHQIRLQLSMRKQFEKELQQHIDRNQHWQTVYDQISARHDYEILALRKEIVAEFDGYQMANQIARDNQSALNQTRQELERLRAALMKSQDDNERLRQENVSLTGTLAFETDARKRLQVERDRLSAELDRYARKAVKAEFRFRTKLQRFEKAREFVLRTVETLVDS